jgi:hypothetical protein
VREDIPREDHRHHCRPAPAWQADEAACPRRRGDNGWPGERPASDRGDAASEQCSQTGRRGTWLAVWFGRIGLVHLLPSRLVEAIVWLEKARNANPALPYVHSRLAAAYALNGDTERAGVELAEARKLGANHHASIAKLLKAGWSGSGYWGVPKIRALFEATYFAGLHKAGMPEE